MRIKKLVNKNEYIQTKSGVWIRNFNKKGVPLLDINNLIAPHEFKQILLNEQENLRLSIPNIELEEFEHPDIVIISDGYGFESACRDVLEKLPKTITIIGVNGSLKKWPIKSRNMNYYLSNNPFREVMNDLPNRRTLPKGIFSSRVYHEFAEIYTGAKYFYDPVPSKTYGLKNASSQIKIDDYRNPLVAAIRFAQIVGCQRLCLLCCDDLLSFERVGNKKLTENTWIFPQQIMAHEIIDGNLFWIKNSSIFPMSVVYNSCGLPFENADAIKTEDIAKYFGVTE